MDQSLAIDVRHLRKVYGEVVAVDDLTFSVPRGAVLGLLGGNGAGKPSGAGNGTGSGSAQTAVTTTVTIVISIVL